MIILLTIIVRYGAFICTPSRDKVLFIIIMVRTFCRLLFFIVRGLIIFFVFFEAGLIPLMAIILG